MRTTTFGVLGLVLCATTLAYAADTAPAAASIPPRPRLSILLDPNIGTSGNYGIRQLTAALHERGWTIERAADFRNVPGDAVLMVSRAAIPDAVRTGREPAQTLDLPEAFAVRKFNASGKPALLITGADDRGIMYAALDAADRVRATGDAAHPFAEIPDTVEKPFIQDRTLSVYTMNRAHWESRFYDERYWMRYFDLLAASRFNRFLIIFGYENGGFLAPPYPYFFDTPGFGGVRMVGLTAEQQHKNLAALNRLIELAHERGIAVSLGIWDHIYRAGVQTGGAEWIGDYRGRPVPNTVEGVTTENLNSYTLASLHELLLRVPALDGLQFRIHEESGLKREEMDDFWRAVFQQVHGQRPELLIEARAKGTPDSVIATALGLGVKLRIETKYWMEQMGLPFHPMHVNPPDQQNRRHGYADLLRYPQRYQIDWRLWNGGTSRILLWGDPEYVRRYSQSTLIYRSPNWDVQEPLATKMEAQRPDMPTFDLMPGKYRYTDYEFERYWHFYQLWGRLGYNPDAAPDFWQREFQRRFGPAGADLADGLHRASTILPMIVSSVYPYRLFPTTRGWAERQSLGAKLADYAKNEGTDTELFESFAEAAKRIVAGGATAKRTPVQTSRWFGDAAAAVLAAVDAAEAKTPATKRSREFESTTTDLRILAQLARFHSHRAIAAVHFNLFTTTGRPAELQQTIADERAAVDAWTALVAAAGDRYAFDLAFGARNFDLCGHWRDELVKLQADLKDLETRAVSASADPSEPAWSPLTAGDQEPPAIDHQRVTRATVGVPIRIVARVTDASGVQSVQVRYRHLTQFEDYKTITLLPGSDPNVFTAMIPGDAIVPQWDFMYFLEAIDQRGNGTVWPDPAKESPYVVVRVERP